MRNPSPKTRSHPARREAGGAMVETVLVMPLLVLILAFVIYFGRGVVRVQHAQVMDRYEAWRQANGHPSGPHPDTPQGHTLMNQAFYDDNAEELRYGSSNFFPRDAQDDLIDAAEAFRLETGDLADEAFGRFPNGRSVWFEVQHREPVRAWRQFNGPIRHRHTRLDHTWRHANYWGNESEEDLRNGGTAMYASLRDVFYDDLDQELQDLANGGNDMARMVRHLYLYYEGYRGPTVYRPFTP